MEPKPSRTGGGLGELMAVEVLDEREANGEVQVQQQQEEKEALVLLREQEQEQEQEQEPYVLRALQQTDFRKGYLQLLEQLTKVGDVTEDSFRRRVQELQELRNYHRTVVIEDIDRGLVVATGTLLIEPKFVRSCGKAGHIEDVVVDRGIRGRHLGQKVVNCLVKIARELGCYKVILDCRRENAPFYEKCGFSEKELQMAQYF